jgi:hypothetical protein
LQSASVETILEPLVKLRTVVNGRTPVTNRRQDASLPTFRTLTNLRGLSKNPLRI